MALDPQQLQHVFNWLKAKNPSPHCQTCQGKHFEAQGIVGVLDYQGGALSTGTSCPLVLLTCKDCGRAEFFSAITMGLPPFNASSASPGT